MSRDDGHTWWPPFATVPDALRRVGRSDIADALRDAVHGGATGTEILGRVGLVLDAHDAARAALDRDAQNAWDEMMRDVNKSYPVRAAAYWMRRLFRR